MNYINALGWGIFIATESFLIFTYFTTIVCAYYGVDWIETMEEKEIKKIILRTFFKFILIGGLAVFLIKI